ncbi:serine/threonine-protein kinase [Candidatus Uabimicrobium amorphum]|uniref:Protein kinase domain-containing protein n=1 Tax=Uabimicrobium amorphum TaxID=2596890 RepID=A0A5S9IMR9_UABAM|nr:serine/threonine-protein kinase [Candidatus Uabimicrobium amorphum]BBM84387.1 hypothetical protein UABAM_02746 [Candidatus Uabimicrobium amorphum]
MELLNNRYELRKILGEGGMGRVYFATDTHSKKNVAIKECQVSTRRDIKRIEREFSFLHKINSVNVVRGLEYFSIEGRYFIVMQYIQGITLDKLIEKKPSHIGLDEQLNIITEICKAVTVLHEYGIVHRDIKPENIMLVGNEYRPVLLDLGIAKMVNKELTAITQTNEVIGTAGYISPEQINGRVAANSDVFSLGVMFYQFLNWETQSPFCGSRIINTLMNIHRKKLPLISETISSDKDYLHKLAKIIDLSLEKDSVIRTSSVAVMLDQLKNINKKRFVASGKFWKQLNKAKWYILCGLIIVSILLYIRKSSLDEQKAVDYASRISQLYGLQAYTKALEVCNKVIAEGLDDDDLYFRRGSIYLELKEYQKSIVDFKKAVELGFKESSAYNNMGFSYYKLQQYEEAIKYLNRAVKITPSAHAYNTLGNCYFILNKYDLALEKFKQALKIKPIAYAYENVGNVYQVQKKYLPAIANFSKAIELKPYSSTAFNNRGLVYFELKEFEKALKDLKKARSLNPLVPEPYISLARYHYYFRHFNRVIELYTRAIELEPRIDFYSSRGLVYFQQKKYQKALADFSHVITMDTSFVDAYLKRATIYYILRKFDDALLDIKKIKELQPNFADAYLLEGNVLHALGRLDECIQKWKKSMELNPSYTTGLEERIKNVKAQMKKNK